ncbi:MAG: hypothetical protein HYU69_13035 [Bacteroidetes bacterium]|nr:hypothetical protein [Bacteroidota bacterium]
MKNNFIPQKSAPTEYSSGNADSKWGMEELALEEENNFSKCREAITDSKSKMQLFAPYGIYDSTDGISYPISSDHM